MLKLDLNHVIAKIPFEDYKESVKVINKMIDDKSGKGNDFLGWTTWPSDYDKEEVTRMLKAAEDIKNNYETLVVCGIGGSYLGARAAIEALNGLYPSNQIEIIYLGQTLSPNYVSQVIAYLRNKKFAVNVISKSGTTTETSIAFRLLKELLIEKYGREGAAKAIYATTDKARGALKQEANSEGYETFIIPDDIGGRYSVITAVGLLPIAVAGGDIVALLNGANQARIDFDNDDLDNNICYQYAVARNYFYTHGKCVEMYVTYEPQHTQIGEWLKQLYGESEGKEKKGLLPSSVTFSTDLHSLGQFIQDGSPIMFETIIRVDNPQSDVIINADKDNLDGLNYLEGKNLAFVNEKAYLGTLKAHEIDGNVPNIVITMDEMNSYNLGYLFYFFMRACALSAYLMDINPFNQPGVEIYKYNMFKLLGKPGIK